MKKLKKIVLIILLVFIIIMLSTQKIIATSSQSIIQPLEYSEDYKKWLKLSDEEKKKVIMPRIYDVPFSSSTNKNIIHQAQMVGASLTQKYSLRNVIPENTKIRNQEQTNSCWAFAAISSLETNLAMRNYRNPEYVSEIYDFSERHMEYATSRIFANNQINSIGFNRNVGDGGNYYIAETYLTTGAGAILEGDMPFENNEDTINLSSIQNKTIASQVYDTIEFPNYQIYTEEKTEIMNQIKQHIQNYGAVFACIHGNSSSTTAFPCYNNDTGAKYCNNVFAHQYDHAVSIIGWDDNYDINNFSEQARPTQKGAWIIRNSWGEKLEYRLAELKEAIFEANKEQCIKRGWNTAEEIPNSIIEENGYTIENDMAYMKIGDNGLMYVSYEDKNVGKALWGIIKADGKVNYENIYKYDDYFPCSDITLNSSNMILCNIFNKKTSGKEYLTQVSLRAPEIYKCKVYVNPNGTGKSSKDMQLVQLKSGETQTIDKGYHTLEFAKPIEVTGNNFAIAVEVQGERRGINIAQEIKTSELPTLDYVTVQSGKCFIGSTNNFDTCEWMDIGNLSKIDSSLPNGDSTLRAFTVSEIIDDSLKNIEITTPPAKTTYFEGENFDKTGMVVKANYNNKTSRILDNSSYSITNGNNLKVGQKEVTITYEDKSVNQQITVEENNVTELNIKVPPTKTNYKEGQSFDKTGMIIEAKYKNGETKEVTDYTIENGNNLKANQTYVTISYGDKTINQPITVTPNALLEIKITKAPNKTKYVVGQNFDKTGMIVKGIYQDESEEEIKDYTIENGSNLTKQQTEVTIKYDGKTTTQRITVEEKAITEISINTKPTKTKYIQNKETLDLTGGSINVGYNDGTTEKIDLKSEQIKVSGFDNTKLGKNIITVTYENKTTTFDVEIVSEEKPEPKPEENPKNSNLEKANINISDIKIYLFPNESEKNYTLIDITLNNIERYDINDKYEYYYYISSNQNEKNIIDWAKIKENQTSKDKLTFSIDTREIKNYTDLSRDDTIYVYIKEVAIKGSNQSLKISKPIEMPKSSDAQVKTYINNTKVDENNSNNKDNNSNNNSQKQNQTKDPTTAPNKIPYTGIRTIIILMVIVAIIGIVVYIRYKNLSTYIK